VSNDISRSLESIRQVSEELAQFGREETTASHNMAHVVTDLAALVRRFRIDASHAEKVRARGGDSHAA
jgi:methyl-accepting chemotaxis protein